MRVLGIDPGYAIVGWGVVEYISNRFAPIGYGAVITEKDTPFEQRLVEIYESVFDICKRYQPEALSIEKLYYQHNQTTVIGVAEARGVILLAAAQCGVPIYEYTPMQVKQAVTGYGKAGKKQNQEMTRIMLHLESVPKPDDTADALGMAIAHCHCSCFHIKLAALCEVCVFIKVVYFKQICCTFACVWCKNWCINKCKPFVVKEITDRFDNSVTDSQDCFLS